MADGYTEWHPWGEIGRSFDGVLPENVLSIDLETTGVRPGDDEILQLAICDGNGREVVNRLYRPFRHRSWPEAERVNGISWSDVSSSETFGPAEARRVSRLLASADLIVGYNWYGFDRRFLEAVGVSVAKPCFDVMVEYSPVPGVWDGYHGHWKWWKLVECAEHYHHDWSGHAHDALSDAVATAWCYRQMVAPGSDYRAVSDAERAGDWDRVLRSGGVTRNEYVEYPQPDAPDDEIARCFVYDMPDGLIAKRAERDLDQAIADRGGRRYRSDAKGARWTVVANPDLDARRCSEIFDKAHGNGKRACYLPDLLDALGVEAKSLKTRWPAGRKRAARELDGWFPVPTELRRSRPGAGNASRPAPISSSCQVDMPALWGELCAKRPGIVRRLLGRFFGD